MKKKLILLLIAGLLVSSCSSKKTMVIQSFELIPVDMSKVDQKDYTDIITIVDNKYGNGNDIFKTASLVKEEAHYIYLRVFSSSDESCYRISIDRNRSKIINIQPDCAVTVE
ncbi:MAG TPA: hypothetical protein VHP36_05565 [Chitinispirillaceae bacterium]|nr:hypothetical protein [Chitinispirillaceae bacterium]